MRARQTLFKDLATPADLRGVIKEDEWNTNLPRYFLQKYRAADFSNIANQKQQFSQKIASWYTDYTKRSPECVYDKDQPSCNSVTFNAFHRWIVDNVKLDVSRTRSIQPKQGLNFTKT
jgi:hypothetical protein